MPFSSSYDIEGIVDKLVEGVQNVEVGERVAVSTKIGGYAEMIYIPKEKVVTVPTRLDPTEVVSFVLNVFVLSRLHDNGLLGSYSYDGLKAFLDIIFRCCPGTDADSHGYVSLPLSFATPTSSITLDERYYSTS